jgi:(1->4)-alpha-D-glucan 1-alpha-D-glucosylmutase
MGLDGDWADTAISIPEGDWRNVLSSEDFAGGAVSVRALTDKFPVALLIRPLD